MATGAAVRPRPAAPGRNLVPGAHRGVAVTDVDCALDEGSLAAFLLGRNAYRRTRFVVARRRGRTAVVAVDKQDEEPLFTPITGVTLLAGPDECAFLHRPDLDTAVPTHLARAALEDAPGARGVVVQGRYAHVSFIVDPAPLRLTVRDVVPPSPPKLLDQARRVLDVVEDLPPIELVSELVDLTVLARSRPRADYLLPCRGGEVGVEGATTWYLDQVPARRPWLLVGCQRSQEIHEWFYGERAEQLDMCPRRAAPAPGTGAVLTKCCLLEREVVTEENQVVVPWGATLDQVSAGLRAVADLWEPSWAPA
jgi:hypothetical protein